jgi:predicted Zn-dependent peptidase
MRLLLFLFLIISTGCLQLQSEEVKKYVLDNGMVLIVKENHANMIVATKLIVKSGAWSEKKLEMGIRNFVQQMLLKGTSERTAKEIAFETDSKGISLSTSVNDDYLEITMVSTSEFFAEGIDILADVVMNPTFPELELEAERGRIKEAIRAQEDDQFTSTFMLFKRALYGDHPYGYNSLGAILSVTAIDRDDLLRYHSQHYVPNNIVVAIVGDVDADEARDLVEENFKDFQPRELPVKPELEIHGEEASVSLVKEREQSFIIMGYRLAPVGSPDYPALKVLNSVLGAGSSSRLFKNIREERGLAYAVGSFYPSRVEGSSLAAYIGTAPENEDEARELMMREFGKLKEEMVPEEELDVAKKRIIGDFALDHESNERQAFYLAWYEAIGMGYEYDGVYPEQVEQVTAEDVQRVARKYFENLVVARVGPG